MYKPNIPDPKTLALIDEVPAEALFEWLGTQLAVAEKAEARIQELREAGKKKFPRATRARALEAPHLRNLIDKIRQETPENRQMLASLNLAATLAEDGERAAKSARLKRDRELLVLHSRYNVRKIDMYSKYDIGRQKLSRSFSILTGDVADKSEEAAWRDADSWHAKYVKALQTEMTARPRRDELFAEMERPSEIRDGEGRVKEGSGYTPAEMARLSGLTPGRITQLRTGSSNASRARRARERQRELQRGGGLTDKIGA